MAASEARRGFQLCVVGSARPVAGDARSRPARRCLVKQLPFGFTAARPERTTPGCSLSAKRQSAHEKHGRAGAEQGRGRRPFMQICSGHLAAQLHGQEPSAAPSLPETSCLPDRCQRAFAGPPPLALHMRHQGPSRSGAGQRRSLLAAGGAPNSGGDRTWHACAPVRYGSDSDGWRLRAGDNFANTNRPGFQQAGTRRTACLQTDHGHSRLPAVRAQHS